MGSAYQGTNFDNQTYGSAGEWNTALNNPVSSSSGTGSGYIQVVVGVPDSTFRMVAKGLKPNTVHTAFLLTRDVSSDCAPIAGSNTSPASNTTAQSNTSYTFGAQLITDVAGNLVFDYHFKPTNAPFPAGQLLDRNKVISMIPIGKYIFKVSNADGTSYAQNYIEAKTASSVSGPIQTW